MPDLIANKSMRYATRMLTADEPFQASNRDARLLVALKRARHAPVEPVEPEPSIDELRVQAEGLGVDIDKRWGEKRLKDEIAKAARD